MIQPYRQDLWLWGGEEGGNGDENGVIVLEGMKIEVPRNGRLQFYP